MASPKKTRSGKSTEKAKKALGEWLAMGRLERLEKGLAVSQEGFAKAWGVNRQTVMRWKKDDPFVAQSYDRAVGKRKRAIEPRKYNRFHWEGPAAIAKAEAEWGEPVEGAALVEHGSGNGDSALAVAADPLSKEFEEIRRALVADAKQGGKGLDAYMRYIGQHVLAQERAAQESGFSELSDEELVDEVLSLVGPEAVSAWLEG